MGTSLGEKQSSASGKFFLDLNGGPESGAILARALLSPESAVLRLVLPHGLASLHREPLLNRGLHVIDAVGFLENNQATRVEAIGRVNLWATAAIVELEEFVDRSIRRLPDCILA